MKLSIKRNPDHPSMMGTGYRYFLDDLDVTDGLMELRLSLSASDINRVDITFLVNDLDIDVEAMTALETVVNTKVENE